MKRQFSVAVSLSLLAFAACGPAALEKASKVELPRGSAERLAELKASEFARDSARFAFSAQAATRDIDVISYALKLRFDWNARRLLAETDVVVERAQAGAGTIELDARMDSVSAVTLATGEALEHEWNRGAGLLKIELPASTAKNVTVRVSSATSGALTGAVRSIAPRKGDAVRSRVVYTHSEPFGASRWFPCNNVPSDRARVSFEFEVSKDESVLANGRLLGIEEKSSSRIYRYATDYTLPTYITAFAAGQFDTVTRDYDGRLPLQIWHRRGLKVDTAGLLDVTARHIAHFESLLVPYPYEKYAIALLPDFGGGEENVGITFNDETRSSQSGLDPDLSLMAHELGHQWFGDYITVRTWDDLWVKEGMATLLSAEASRPEEDMRGSGRLNGNEFWAKDGEAIRDPSLAPESKYTSGPYDRAAWFYTQLRGVVGEQKFWSTLRKMLQDNAFGVVGTEDVLRYFEPHLGAAMTARARQALAAKRVPVLSIESSADKLTLGLADPDRALLAPVIFRWFTADNTFFDRTLAVGQTVDFDLAKPGLLVADPNDQHPDPTAFLAYSAHVAPLYVPRTAAALKSLLASNPAAQLRATESASPESEWSALEPASFTALWVGLDSQRARVNSLEVACRVAVAGGMTDAWRNVIENAATSLPTRGLVYSRRLESCWSAVQPTPLAELYALLEAKPSDARLDEKTVTMLSRFNLPAERNAAVWAPLAVEASSVRRAQIAVDELARGLKLAVVGSPAREAHLEALRRVLVENRVNRVVNTALVAVKGAGDKAALLSILSLANETDPVREQLRVDSLCAAWSITGEGKAPEWTKFRASLNESLFTGWTREYLTKPETCGQ
jgi:hypothetical protein